MGTNVPPRPVSVEELLDLDQQVDFFLALGQAHSATDLLLGQAGYEHILRRDHLTALDWIPAGAAEMAKPQSMIAAQRLTAMNQLRDEDLVVGVVVNGKEPDIERMVRDHPPQKVTTDEGEFLRALPVRLNTPPP
jgi:hypothetical protein